MPRNNHFNVMLTALEDAQSALDAVYSATDAARGAALLAFEEFDDGMEIVHRINVVTDPLDELADRLDTLIGELEATG